MDKIDDRLWESIGKEISIEREGGAQTDRKDPVRETLWKSNGRLYVNIVLWEGCCRHTYGRHSKVE